MSYTANTIKRHLMIFGGGVLFITLLYAVSGDDNAFLAMGLAGLVIGAVYGCGLIIAALVVVITNANASAKRPVGGEPTLVDDQGGVREISAKERSRAYLISGLLILLIGGSLCFGSLTMGSSIKIH